MSSVQSVGEKNYLCVDWTLAQGVWAFIAVVFTKSPQTFSTSDLQIENH